MNGPGAPSAGAPWTKRLIPLVWFLLASSLAALAPTIDLIWRAGAAGAGGLLATLSALVWRARTRPAVTWRWALIGAAGLVAAAFAPAWAATGLAAAAVTLFLIHDHPAGPGAILLLGTVVVLWQPSGTWSLAGQEEAWWVGASVVAVVVAAMLERDRLAARIGTPTAATGAVARILWVGAWTAGFLVLREWLPLAAWISGTGLDLSRTSGRIALVAILLLAIAIGGLLLRSRRGPSGESAH